MITIIHIAFDLLKSLILKLTNNNAKIDLAVFFIDQLLHIFSVIIIYSFFEEEFVVNSNTNINLFIISIYLIVIYIGDYAIQKTFKLIKLKSYEQKEQDIQGIGSLIGKFERIIILTMLIVNQPTVIIALIGIKSIARFPEFSKDKDNDYFILGNLLSLFFAIIGYVLYLFINNL